MSLTVFTGLPATGKTSAIIRSMREHERAGGKVALFLSAEHKELTRRPNVRPGGLMGCRDPELNFKIDHVLKTDATVACLETLEPGTMAVFDEAHFFKPSIVRAWQTAAQRGLQILVGTPSRAQLEQLEDSGSAATELTVPCRCGKADATSVIYEDNMTYPIHLCDECNAEQYNAIMKQLLEEIRVSEPFPGEKKTYQPFFDVDMEGWDFVRGDSMARFRLMEDAVARCPSINPTVDSADTRLSYLDLGCCSGFFCDAMDDIGFSSTGVDVTKNFIDWCNRLAKFKGQNISYIKEDAKKFITGSDEKVDVTSTFATLQWVMTQQGYEAGLDCFKQLFDRTEHICVVEMGYTLEDIYKDRIPDRPREIDQKWVLDIMREFGDFAVIEVYPAGENGIWRDIFIGYKEVPAKRPFRRQFENDELEQISTAQQHWDDKWVGEAFEVYFRAKKSLKTGLLKGWAPERADGSEAIVSVSINGVEMEALTVENNLFECRFPCEIAEGEMFFVSINSTPIQSESSEDIRPLAFTLMELSIS